MTRGYRRDADREDRTPRRPRRRLVSRWSNPPVAGSKGRLVMGQVGGRLLHAHFVMVRTDGDALEGGFVKAQIDQ